MHFRLVCSGCGEAHAPSAHPFGCRCCGLPLFVEYDPPRAMERIPGPVPAMPLHRRDPSMSLGEGNTPVIALANIGRRLDLAQLYAKLEYINPTGSFKDRGSAVLVAVLQEYDVKQVAEDSSGNAGASIAAYCARAAIQATVFVPASAPDMKLEQIAFYGAALRKIDGSRQAVTEACEQYCRNAGVVYASHNRSPYFIEGTKTFAYEVWRQMTPLPDHILFPVGNGSLLLGAWRGFGELLAGRHIQRAPRLHCVQSRACMPIVAAFHQQPWAPPPGGVTTIAGGIAVQQPPRLPQVLQALEESGGTALAVVEESIAQWQRHLAEEEGVFVEPTSAAALAGLEALCQQGQVSASERVLVPLTGFGLKDRIPPGTFNNRTAEG